MCDTCGCGQSEPIILKPGEEYTHTHDGVTHTHSHGEQEDPLHAHSHSHEPGQPQPHDHGHNHPHAREVRVEQDVLSRNNLLAERNRGFFEARGILALNLVSSPGSGKTSLLERTVRELGKELDFYIIEGDQQSMNDARRIDKAGAPVVQVNTGEGCHLDADMVNRAVKKLEVPQQAVLLIENVGNLVCPALFDLGESFRVVIMSCTEGDDKPQKYPYMFRSSGLCLINKTDLLPYVDFKVDRAREYARQINPELKFIELSVKTGEGMDMWYGWLKDQA